jgi:hypothetical protein
VQRRGPYRADPGRRKELLADLKHRRVKGYSLTERFHRAYHETFDDETAFSVMVQPDKRVRALRMVLLAAVHWDPDRATAPRLTEFQGLGHCVTVDGRATWSACKRPDFKEVLIVHKQGWLWNYDKMIIAKVREALDILANDLAFAQPESQAASAPALAGPKDEDTPKQGPALTKPEQLTLCTLADLDPAVLASTADIAEAMDAAERLSERTIKSSVRELIELGLAERPEGPKQGARLTIKGRRLVPKITP